ncbi:ligand-binding protein SH3 [Paenibacillus sp. FSL H8-0548]|uniref:DMT family transporter n=1 Tax=Paenibacillus sp. FSL H8-0548 TaxID=1920422 RepID=UPI00096CF6D1|nr:multidrug efflux SMR transporter [Paenibacillus sp. FSL H8-0548]OMF37210.1 ligand-binding protein SH3 [Paenibacillus sp. FSL H8-0548]
MQWIFLLLAGFLEVGWTFGLKYSEGFTLLVPSLITIVLLAASFMLFARAMRTIEIGVAYAMFTGIGTVGTVIAGILVLHEPADFWRLFFIALLVGGIVGLKLVSKEKPLAAEAQAQESSSIETAVIDNKDREKVGT